MKLILILSISLNILMARCDRSDDLSGEKTTVTAYLVNDLAVDGCSWHFSQISGRDLTISYAPDAPSQPLLERVIHDSAPQNGLYRIPVRVKFAVTGKKKSVTCGWGKTIQMDAVRVYDLQIIEE